MAVMEVTRDPRSPPDESGPRSEINISDLIESRRLGGFQFRIIALCAMVMLIDGFNTQIIGYIAPLIAKEWGMSRSALGPIFSLGLAGLMAGYLIFSPFSDKFGHKRILIAAVLGVSLFTFLTATATGVTQIGLYRFLTGLGLGAATPSAVALTSEYSPKRIRATAVLIIYCGFSLGFVIAGAVAAQLAPLYGWHALLWVGGGVPLVLSFVLAAALPESLDYMVARRVPPARIMKILRHLAPGLTVDAGTRFKIDDGKQAAVPFFVVFERQRAIGTVLIWIAFFMNLGVFYALQSWLPTILTNYGYSIGNVATVTGLTTAGGIAAVFAVGPLMDRHNPYIAVATLFLGGCVFVVLLGTALTWSLPLLMLIAFGAGVTVSGGQKSGIALSALFYPLAIRSTGVGWALGVSRLGGIFGPLLFGWLLDLGWLPSSVFLAGAAPMAIAGVAVLEMGRIYYRKSRPAAATARGDNAAIEG